MKESAAAKRARRDWLAKIRLGPGDSESPLQPANDFRRQRFDLAGIHVIGSGDGGDVERLIGSGGGAQSFGHTRERAAIHLHYEIH